MAKIETNSLGNVTSQDAITDEAILRGDTSSSSYGIQDSTASISDTGDVELQTTTDSQSAFVIKDSGNNDVFFAETTRYDLATSAPSTFTIEPYGFGPIPGSGNFIRGMRYRAEIGSGTQTNAFRGFDTLLRVAGSAAATGDNSLRANNASVAWNSTGTCESMIGMQNFLACGGGAGVTTGLITEAVANKALIGFNTNDAGSYTDGICFFAGPNRVDATHTITNFYGLKIDDCDITGITNAYAIQTGTGTVEIGDDLIFNSDGSGLSFGEITAYDVGSTVSIASSGKANKVQITAFATNGESNNMTPDHTNDHVTVVSAGKYMCTVSLSAESGAGGGAEFGFSVWKNNGATELQNVHAHRDFSGGGGDVGSISMSGIVDLAASDTIEVWAWNEDNTDDIVIDDITLSLIQIGG